MEKFGLENFHSEDSFFDEEKFEKAKVIKRKKKEKGISRRKFLKGLLATGAALGLGADFWGFQEEQGSDEQEIGNTLEEIYPEEGEKNLEEKIETKEEEEIGEEDARSIQEIIDYHHQGPIKIDRQASQQLTAYWKREYKEGRLKNDLKRAWQEMGAWQKYLEQIFQEEGVPTKFLYLAIPESHWRLGAYSRAGAAGPYQFIKKTARHLGLLVGEEIDERRDPLKSARACARLLKRLYRSCNKDWDLALSGYNGGFVWHFIKEAKKSDQEVSYDNFLAFLEKKINRLRDEIKEKSHWSYKVKKGDTLFKLARRFHLSVEEIKEVNSLRDSNIKIGQRLKLPLKEKDKEYVFQKKIRGFKENLNYPPKFNAVIDLIQEEDLGPQKPLFQFREITITESEDLIYKIKKGDTLYSISRHYCVPLSLLRKMNPSYLENRLPVGGLLRIPKKIPPSGYIFARQQGISLGKFKKLNPGLVDLSSPLPPGYKIRV